MQEHFILDNILSGEELLWIYHRLIETPSWTLSRTSSGPGRNMLPFMGFPGLNVETKGDIHNEFFAGYFRSILFRVKHALKRDFSAQIPPEVLRIHVGAKSSFSKTEFHIDSDNKSYWTILGFLNPVWIEYKAGRFVVFPSSVKHDGGYVINETLSYWRIAVNIILRPSTADNSAAY
jgi:hypothetical protein